MSLLDKVTYCLVIVGWGLVATAVFTWGEGQYIAILIGGIVCIVLAEIIHPGDMADINENEGEENVRFSIISSSDKRDQIAELIKDQPQIVGIYGEEGRQYSRPDNDDNEKWFALRVSCHHKHRDDLMARIEDKVRKSLGDKVADELRIDYF